MTTGIRTETVTFQAGGATSKSYLAFDRSTKGKRPGVVLFGEWWGLNEYQKRRARQLAEIGYVTLAVDMYGGGATAANAEEAGQLMNGLFADMPGTSDKVRAAVARLAARPEVDAGRMGAMGYCMGGAMALHAARLGLDLRGVASFHGSLGKTHEASRGQVKARVLVCHGEDDSFVSAEEQAAFREEMASLGVDYRFIAYPGAKHAFTNPDANENGRKYNLPLEYNEQADRESWQEMKAFWAEVFA
jgi:dienelactone hydrolase